MMISVVIPVFNDRRIASALNSIRSQVLADDLRVEVIVIDAGSDDGTLDVIRSYEDVVTKLVSEPDKGIFDALNKGIHMSTGDVIGLLGADDCYSDSLVLKNVSESLEKSKKDVCYGDLIYVDDEDKIVRYWKSGSFKRSKLVMGWLPPHFTVFARRSVYERVGDFNLKYRVAADSDHMIRMFWKHKFSAAYIDRVLVHMKLGGNSNKSVSSVFTGNRETFDAWRSQNIFIGCIATLLKPTQKIIQLIHRP